jgi:hypothetical protein
MATIWIDTHCWHKDKAYPMSFERCCFCGITFIERQRSKLPHDRHGKFHPDAPDGPFLTKPSKGCITRLGQTEDLLEL